MFLERLVLEGNIEIRILNNEVTHTSEKIV